MYKRQVYRQERDHRLLEVLLLHNADDIRGMLSVVPILSYPELFESIPSAVGAETDLCTDYAGNIQKELLVRLTFPAALPVPLSFHGGGCYFSGSENTGTLKIPCLLYTSLLFPVLRSPPSGVFTIIPASVPRCSGQSPSSGTSPHRCRSLYICSGQWWR